MDIGSRMMELPEECLATIMSFTTPGDACRLSTVSSMFKSAVESDTVWKRFLPENYVSLIAGSSDPSLLERFPSKKQLFLHLSKNHILIEAGLKSFSLDKLSGKKCYMLSPRDIWGGSTSYRGHWGLVPEPKSRFNEVGLVVSACWLEIRGMIKTDMLSKNTLYTVNFVFQLTTRIDGFDYNPVEVSVGLVGYEASKRTVHLDTEKIQSRRNTCFLKWRNRDQGLQALSSVAVAAEKTANNHVKVRGDGCLEVEMGNFFNYEGSVDEVLEMCVLEVRRSAWIDGIIVHGIEIRPTEGTNSFDNLSLILVALSSSNMH